MEQEKKIRVAITQGDTNGVGYEVITYYLWLAEDSDLP